MKLHTEGAPLAWAGWLSLAIVLAATLAAWWLSRQNEDASIVIEPLPGQISGVTAPGWPEPGATESPLADEEPGRVLAEPRETDSDPKPQAP